MIVLNAKSIRLKSLLKQKECDSTHTKVKDLVRKAEVDMLSLADIKPTDTDKDIRNKAKEYLSSAHNVVDIIQTLPIVNYDLVSKRNMFLDRIEKMKWYVNNISGQKQVRAFSEYVYVVNQHISNEMKIRNI